MRRNIILTWLLVCSFQPAFAELIGQPRINGQEADTSDFQIRDGKMIGTEGLLVQIQQKPFLLGSTPVSEMTDLLQSDVHFPIPSGWTPVRRDKTQNFYLFRNSQGAAAKVLVLDRRGQTVMKSVLPADVTDSLRSEQPFPVYFDAQGGRLFAISSRAIYQMTGRGFQWKTVFTLKNQYRFSSFLEESVPGYPNASGAPKTPPPTSDGESESAIPLITGFSQSLPVFTINNQLYFKIFSESRDSYLIVKADLSNGILQNIHQSRFIGFSGEQTGGNKLHLVADRYVLFKDSERIIALDLSTNKLTILTDLNYLYTNSELHFFNLPNQRVAFAQNNTTILYTIDLSRGIEQIKTESYRTDNYISAIFPFDEHHIITTSAFDSSSNSDASNSQTKGVPVNPYKESYGPYEIINIDNDERTLLPPLFRKIALENFVFTPNHQLYLNANLTKNSPEKLIRIDLENFLQYHPGNSSSSFSARLYSTNSKTGARSESNPGFIAALQGFPQVYEDDNQSYKEIALSFFLKNPRALEFSLGLMLKSFKGDHISYTTAIWDQYKAFLSSLLSSYSRPQKEFWIEEIAVTLTDILVKSGNVPRIPPSKIANTLIVSLKKAMGISIDDRIDFFINPMSEDNQNTPYLVSNVELSLAPTEFTDHTSYLGINIYTLNPVRVGAGDTVPFSIPFFKNGEPWKVHGTATGINIADEKPITPSLPYSRFRKDGILTGAFVIARNLGDGFEKQAAKILRYYLSQGYVFGFPTVKWKENSLDLVDKLKESILFTTNVERNVPGKKWLTEMIASGKLDYLVKEGHSAGSDYVLEMSNFNNMVIGRKFGLNGVTEIVYILYPDQEDNRQGKLNSEYLSATELNTFLEEREKRNGAEFLFINSSCWSSENAARELAENKNNLLIEIATIDVSPTFGTNPDNAERNLVHYLRHNLNYQQMRDEIAKLNKANSFIFPDDPNYKSFIWDRVGKRVNYSAQFSRATPADLKPQSVCASTGCRIKK